MEREVSEVPKMYICDVCGEPTPNYREYSPSMAAILGKQGYSTCDGCLREAHILHKWRKVYCPDNGGALRLTYDLRMQAAKSLREDSTLCLLWAMLMDSYSRWRTTWDVFNETGESCDL